MEGRGGGEISHASTSSAGCLRLRAAPAGAGATAPPGSTPRQTTSSERGPGGGSSNGSKVSAVTQPLAGVTEPALARGARGTPGVWGAGVGDFFGFLRQGLSARHRAPPPASEQPKPASQRQQKAFKIPYARHDSLQSQCPKQAPTRRGMARAEMLGAGRRGWGGPRRGKGGDRRRERKEKRQK